MEKVHCLNLCEILEGLMTTYSSIEEVLRQANEKAGFKECERIYIGSSFCNQYFLHLKEELSKKVIEVCKKRGIRLTLVVPMFTQKHLDEGKQKIASYSNYFGEIIDEITVNDYGMLAYIHEQYKVGLNMGRLFMKDYRDLRYEAYFNAKLEPKLFTHYLDEVIKAYDVKGIECDLTHHCISFLHRPKEVCIGVHRPYCYMTVGQICEFASIHHPIEKKFRPNTPCSSECVKGHISYHFEDGHKWIRQGRVIYFDNRDAILEDIQKIRDIYFPLDLEVD